MLDGSAEWSAEIAAASPAAQVTALMPYVKGVASFDRELAIASNETAMSTAAQMSMAETGIELALQRDDKKETLGRRGPMLADRADFNRTPRPPSVLEAPSPISSIPAISRAATSLVRESTLPRITPSLASIRWMVGSESPASLASRR